MWYFSVHGFYSVVHAREGDGTTPRAKLDPSRVMVRSRVREHLSNLQVAYPDLLGEYEIKTSHRADYRYRLIIEKDEWVQVAKRLAQDQDYGNFKSAVRERQGPSDYERSLHEVWTVMHRLQIDLSKGEDS